MKREELAELPKEQLVALVELLIDNYYSLDGLWFQSVEQQFGTDKAIEMDEAVWNVLGKIEGRRLKKAFGLTGSGMPAILEALRLNPTLTAFGPSEIEQLSDNRLTYSVLECIPQKARLQKGQQLFRCQGVQQGFLSNFARQFEPGVEVSCMLCPPDKFHENRWCQWMFEVKDDDGVAVPSTTGQSGG